MLCRVEVKRGNIYNHAIKFCNTLYVCTLRGNPIGVKHDFKKTPSFAKLSLL